MTSNINIYSSTPRTVFRGIRDDGAVNILMPVESAAIRLPLFFNFAPWGSYDEPVYVNGNSIGVTNGPETLMPRSKFFNHQSVFMRSQFTGGGSAIFHRLQAEGAKSATMRLSLDVVADLVTDYERNGDGSYKRTAEGELIVSGSSNQGFRSQWKLTEVPEEDEGFAEGKPLEGTLIAEDEGTLSKSYPIVDFEARWEGAIGNNMGIRLSAPGATGRNPIDPELQERLDSVIYRMQVVTRATASSTPQVMPTLMSEDAIDFTFDPSAVDLTVDKEYGLERILNNSYESVDKTEFNGYGPFSEVHVYHNHIEELLTKFADAEAEHTSEELPSVDLFNFLTGRDVNGIPYYTYLVEGPADGGLLMGENTSLFMLGGDDGDISVEAYNTKVFELLGNLDNSTVAFEDIARLPYDSVWDSGFPIETKLLFKNFHSLRPDVYIHVCTQDVTKKLNSPSEDTSVGMTLRGHFRAATESDEFGTKAARVAVFNCAGKILDDEYRGLVPFMEWVCMKGAEYMGASDGSMKSANSFGRGEQNIVTRYYDHNAGRKRLNARNVDWNNGVNYSEYYDMNRLFYPGLQSIYSDSTSPLRSYMNVQIVCNLTRIGHMVWRELTGDDQFDDESFLAEVNRRVAQRTFEKYDKRAVVTPNAYYTAMDNALGTHYHLDIEAAFNNMKTVQLLTIVSKRSRSQEA